MVGIKSQIFYVFDVQNLPRISIREVEQWNLMAGTVKPSENEVTFYTGNLTVAPVLPSLI